MYACMFDDRFDKQAFSRVRLMEYAIQTCFRIHMFDNEFDKQTCSLA